MKHTKKNKEELLKKFIETFGDTVVDKAIKYLKSKRKYSTWLGYVMDNYESVTCISFKASIICTFGNPKEFISCFITYNNTKEGRDYWTKVSNEWIDKHCRKY